MRISFKSVFFLLAILFVGVFVFCYNAKAQGTSGTVQGVVKDQTGAIVAGAKVDISNKVSPAIQSLSRTSDSANLRSLLQRRGRAIRHSRRARYSAHIGRGEYRCDR